MTAVAACERAIGDAVVDATARLAAAGVPEPRADAEVLLAHVLGISRPMLSVRRRDPLPAAIATRFDDLVARRASREPVFHLVGEREFWSLPFAVDRRVLTPRPETELLVGVACRLAPGARRVLDAGTGSGCVAVALARTLPAARVCAIDRSADALDVAVANCGRHAPAVDLVRGDWLAAFGPGSFDLIVANPPYVRDDELAGLEPEVRVFEPSMALTSGPDGLDAVRTLLSAAPPALKPGGWLVLEIGAGQVDAVTALPRGWARGAGDVSSFRDHAGIDRVVAVRKGED